MKMNLDPKVAVGVIAVVVLGAAFLVIKGASSSPKTPLPDPSLFNGGHSKTAPVPPK